MPRGGTREGAGRKVGWRKGYSDARQGHQIRLHEDEWEVVKMFANLVKQDINKGRETLKKIRRGTWKSLIIYCCFNK